MVISFASRSASRMISSNALRRISPRSRGFFAAQAGCAAAAASTAALASSTVALATEATVFSVAGSITSKRPPSDALRHLPPIQRSVGTLARRFSYIGLVLRIQVSELKRRPCRSVTSPRLRGEVGRESGRVSGSLQELGTWRAPLTPPLSPQAGRGSTPPLPQCFRVNLTITANYD